VAPREPAPPAPAGVDAAEARRIAAEIDRIRRRLSVSSTPALTKLTSTLRQRPESLTNRDLSTAFPSDALLPDGPRRGWDTLLLILRLVRDTLVFVPVLTTWHGLKGAVTAQAQPQYKAKHPDQSFLAGWENGFDGHSGTLAHTAGVVIGIIATLIALTALIVLVEGWCDRREEHARDDLDRQLALATLALAVPPSAASEPVSIDRLNQLITSIGAAATRLSDALDRAGTQIVDTMAVDPGTVMGQALSSWTEAAAGLTALGKDLKTPATAVSELAALRRGFADDQLAWREQANRLILQLQDATSASVTEAMQHQAVAEHVVTISRQVGEEIRLVGESLEGLRNRYELVDGVMERLREVMEWLQNRLADGPQAAAPPPPRRPTDAYGIPGSGPPGYPAPGYAAPGYGAGYADAGYADAAHGTAGPAEGWDNPRPPGPGPAPGDGAYPDGAPAGPPAGPLGDAAPVPGRPWVARPPVPGQAPDDPNATELP
jgi:hypothetical protein